MGSAYGGRMIGEWNDGGGGRYPKDPLGEVIAGPDPGHSPYPPAEAQPLQSGEGHNEAQPCDLGKLPDPQLSSDRRRWAVLVLAQTAEGKNTLKEIRRDLPRRDQALTLAAQVAASYGLALPAPNSGQRRVYRSADGFLVAIEGTPGSLPLEAMVFEVRVLAQE